MKRIALIFLLAAVFCSGCETQRSREIDATWQKYCQVKKGMPRSEVLAIEPTPDVTFDTNDGQQTRWSRGDPFANEKYISMRIIFGKDGQVDDIQREIGKGKEPALPNDFVVEPWHWHYLEPWRW